MADGTRRRPYVLPGRGPASGTASSDGGAAAVEAIAAEVRALATAPEATPAGRIEAIHAAAGVAPDDPRHTATGPREDGEPTGANPFGRPGRPMSARSPFRVGFAAALGVAVAYFLVQAVTNARQVLILIVVAAFLAIGLNPTVVWLERRGLGRGRAVGTVFALVVLFFVGIGAAVVPPLVSQGTSFVESVPDYLDRLAENPTAARLNEQFQIVNRVRSVTDDPNLGTRAFGGVVGVGKVVLGAFFSALTVLILTLYFLSSYPAIKSTAYSLVPRSRRARVALIGDEILGRVGGYVAGAITIASIAGLSTGLYLASVGVPYPLALAVLVSFTDLIPLIGATIGAVVVTVVAFFVSVPVGIATGIFYLVYQQLENYLLYPRIMSRSVDVSPAATIVAVLIGAALLGVVGALLAIPTAAAISLVIREVVVPRQEKG